MTRAFLFQHFVKIEKEVDYEILITDYSKLMHDVLENHINFCGNIEIDGDPILGYVPANEHIPYPFVFIKAFIRLKNTEVEY